MLLQKKIPARIRKRDVNPKKYIKKDEEQQKKADKRDQSIKNNDHKKMAKKVSYHGSTKIGRVYKSEDDDYTTDF